MTRDNLYKGVYLISNEKKTLLKIGKSENVINRFNSMLTVNPDLKILGYLRIEDLSLEKILHFKFKSFHYKREWFHYTEEIISNFKQRQEWTLFVENSNGTLLPQGKEIFEPNAHFISSNNTAWSLLRQTLSHLEFSVCFRLSLMVRKNTNSLEPLNDKMTINELTEILHISKNKVTPVLSSLQKYGVYKQPVGRNKYWVFNPYISFDGKPNLETMSLFKETILVKHLTSPTLKTKK